MSDVDGIQIRVPLVTRPAPTWLLPVLRLGVFVLAVAVIAAGVWHARPPHEMTIEVGPVGGSYYENAVKYRELLAARGINLHIITNNNTLDIVNDVADVSVPIQVGFVAEDLPAARDADVSMIGLVQLQPLFIFANAELGRRSVISDLRGRKIVTTPRKSASASAALRIFELMDITEENTSFTFMPLMDAVRELRAGKFDAAVFMLAPDNKLVHEMATDSGLHLVPFEEVHAIANQLPFLRPVVLPRGIYDIADAIPPNDTPLLAASVGVVVQKGLHPWLVYSLLEAIAKTHRGATQISDAGDFPTIRGSQVEVDPLAAQWYKTGVPWIWQDFPPAWASFLACYEPEILAVIALGAFVVVGAFMADILGLLLCALASIGRRRGSG